MRQAGSRRPVFVAIVLLGVFAQIVQAWLIRESLVVFYGNELSLGAFFGSWLFWIALGSLAVIRFRQRGWVVRARGSLSRIMLLLPLLLLAQVAALRGVRFLLDIPSIELIPLGDLFVSVSLLTLPSGFALGVAFPLACKALADLPDDAAVVRGISRLYVAEALGALLGGIAFTFVVLQWLGIWRGFGVLSALLAFAAWPLDGRRASRLAGALVALMGLSLAFTPAAQRLGNYLEQLRFQVLQPGMQLLDAVETRYGHVALARFGSQTSVVRDGQIAESFPQARQVEQTAAYVFAQAPDSRRVLVLEGYASGLTQELLRYPLQRLDQLEQDRRGFERIQPYLPEDAEGALESGRLRLHFGDGRRYLNQLTEPRYDLILALNAVPTSAHGNRYFTREFYARISQVLAPGGVFCTRVSSASNYLGSRVLGYTGSVYQTLHSVFAHIAILPGDEHLYCASATSGRVSEDADELIRRYQRTPLQDRRFPASYFHSLLPMERIVHLRKQLQGSTGDLNTDTRPVTYYLNMLLWGRFSASGFSDWLEQLKRMGPWPYLVPLIVFLGLWLLRLSLQGFARTGLRRQAAVFALAILGLAAMAMQLSILFSYQAQVGFMFERVALLNALFMTGLALGTGFIGQRLARSPAPDAYLSALLLLVAGSVLGFPVLVEHLGHYPVASREAVFLGLSVLFGLLTGAGFPLGVRQTHRDLGEVTATSGLSEAADSFGGALGGLLTGALLVPLLGIEGTGELLALLCVAALLPLLAARYMPAEWPALRARGERAFPWPLAGWLLAFATLTLYGWSLAERGAAPGPQLVFDQHRLAQVSESQAFRLREDAYPLYLGWDGQAVSDAPADTASLSSMAVASDSRGYAGPLNLLISVERGGLLRGVGYVDSNETPSYIEGIADWLAGLRGKDLSKQPLTLNDVDALSGATLSSAAALDAINHSARAAGRDAFALEFAPDNQQADSVAGLRSPRFLVTLALLVAFFPVFFVGNETVRLWFQAVCLGVLGFWLNSLVTEMDLLNLGLGHFSGLSENPQRWLLLGFVLVSGLLFGQVWCGYLCPFGALQEFVSRIGRRLGLRSYPRRPLETRMRFLKFPLLALLLCSAWVTGESFWASFNPMQHLFSLKLDAWMWLLSALVLIGALLHYRFWCRYLCPFGAFMALFNKIALLQRFAPKRRFEHCDLGVKEAFDIDCIRCNRCISGKDTHAKP